MFVIWLGGVGASVSWFPFDLCSVWCVSAGLFGSDLFWLFVYLVVFNSVACSVSLLYLYWYFVVTLWWLLIAV